MAQIYSNASQVLAYICPESTMDNIMDYLNGTPDASIVGGIPPVLSDVKMFLNLPYFDRV